MTKRGKVWLFALIIVFVMAWLARAAPTASPNVTLCPGKPEFRIVGGLFPVNTVPIYTFSMLASKPPSCKQVIKRCPVKSSGAVFYRVTYYLTGLTYEFGFHCYRLINKVDG